MKAFSRLTSQFIETRICWLSTGNKILEIEFEKMAEAEEGEAPQGFRSQWRLMLRKTYGPVRTTAVEEPSRVGEFRGKGKAGS